MINISAVSYLNTKPFILGLQRSHLWNEISVSLETPAQTVIKLLSEEAQVGLVPVAAIHQLKGARLITDYCIGAIGAVKTVCLYSQVPLHQIERIWLDYQSRTSVKLVEVLCAHYWHIQPQLLPASEGFETTIHGTTAGLVIGDRAIALNHQQTFEFVYDLSEAWFNFTQLPFVFAAWVAVTPLPDYFEDALNAAFAFGIQNIAEVAQQYQPAYPPDFDINAYLSHDISYLFDEKKMAGLLNFWGFLDV